MIECDSFGRNLQQFFTIRHCLLGTLFYALSSLSCSFFFSFIFYAFMFLFVPMGPRSSRLNIFFGIQLPYRCEKERNHVQCSFFLLLLLSLGCCYLSADFCVCDCFAMYMLSACLMFYLCASLIAFVPANGSKACTNSQPLAHFVVFHAYLMPSALCHLYVWHSFCCSCCRCSIRNRKKRMKINILRVSTISNVEMHAGSLLQ